MTSKAEKIVSQELRAILAPVATGAPIEHSERLVKLQGALEFFLPEQLGWRHESFDAFRFAIARKAAPEEAEFVGLALLISDQAWTPIHLWLRFSPDSDQSSRVAVPAFFSTRWMKSTSIWTFVRTRDSNSSVRWSSSWRNGTSRPKST